MRGSTDVTQTDRMSSPLLLSIKLPTRIAGVAAQARMLRYGMLLILGMLGPAIRAGDIPAPLSEIIENSCLHCHDESSAEGGLDLTALDWNLDDRVLRDRWIHVHDRVYSGEMPPDADDLIAAERQTLVEQLSDTLGTEDRADVAANGRGPLRRLNREEYEQNLRDVLQLPELDIRDMLPEDREGHRFNKTAATLDMSRVQLTADLEAADAALRQAMATDAKPPMVMKYRATGTRLFPSTSTFGDRQQMVLLRKLFEQLAETREGEDRLLDRTMVLFGSNMGDANTHDNTNLPILLAGGGFQHGQHLAFQRDHNKPLSNLFVTMLQQMGIETDSFGSSTGTLNEITRRPT